MLKIVFGAYDVTLNEINRFHYFSVYLFKCYQWQKWEVILYYIKKKKNMD